MHTIIVNSRDLAQGLGAVIHAASTDTMRPTLNGVLFEGRQGQLRLVAADNYRIAYAEIAADTLSDEPLVLSLDVALALLKDCKALKVPESVTITWDNPDGVTLTYHGTTRRVRGIDGTFPNYVQVIPIDRDNDVTIGLNARMLADIAALTDAKRPTRYGYGQNVGTLRVTFAGPTDPIIVRGEYGTEIIMPVRLS